MVVPVARTPMANISNLRDTQGMYEEWIEGRENFAL
jgi:hypothetical protein